MTTSEFIKVDLTQLKVGLSLKYDLQDLNGKLLAKAGDIVSANLKSRWQVNGIHLANAIITDPIPSDSAASDSHFIKPYDPIMMERLEHSFQQASDYVLRSATRLVEGDYSSAQEARGLLGQMQSDIVDDVSTVLAAFAQCLYQELSENDARIAQRNTQLSILGLILAIQLGYSSEDQQVTALAGMFHDVSLLECVRQGKLNSYDNNYSNHSMDSAWLLESAVGLNAKVSLAVSQLHEQIDGTGFPRRLPANRIIPIARVLNVADAYLTLTSSAQPELFPDACNFHPADALGYLMYHAALGRFDRIVVRALVDATSLYPIGSRVKLSDESTAVVMRSSKNAPSKPIVRIESAHERIVDLRVSNLAIVKPTMSPLDYCRRLRKSELPMVYWR